MIDIETIIKAIPMEKIAEDSDYDGVALELLEEIKGPVHEEYYVASQFCEAYLAGRIGDDEYFNYPASPEFASKMCGELGVSAQFAPVVSDYLNYFHQQGEEWRLREESP